MKISNMQIMVFPFESVKQSMPDAQLGYKIGVPSEHTYTKEEAVRNQYNRQFDIHATIDDIVSGRFDTSNIRCPSFKEEDIEAYRMKLETNGLGDEINWSGVSFDFSSVDVQLDALDKVYSKANYIASRYAVLKERIQTDYSGCKLQEQMEKLNCLFADAKEKLADSYSMRVGSFLSQNGVEGETENLRDSVVLGIEYRVSQYLDYLKSNPDYFTPCSDSEGWLMQDDGYMASMLRDSMAVSAAADTSSINQAAPAYSLRDLEVAGIYAKQTSEQFASMENTGWARNEESIGLELAVQSMKTDYLTKNTGISSSMTSILNRTFEGYTKNYLNKIDEGQKKSAANSKVLNSKEIYSPLDRSSIDRIYQYTMSQYRKTGDIMSALVKGAEYGKEQYTQKSQSKYYPNGSRYNTNAENNWDNFFYVTKKIPYSPNISDLQKYSISINYFKDSVDRGNVQNINLMLGFNGNISANRINYYNMNQYQNCNIDVLS